MTNLRGTHVIVFMSYRGFHLLQSHTHLYGVFNYVNIPIRHPIKYHGSLVGHLF